VIGCRAIGLFALATVLVAATADAPGQPLPFSHKTHPGALKMACKMCRTNPGPGETEGIPPAATCMQCHSAIKTDSPAIRKLTRYFNNKRPIPWVRVYEIPDYMTFSHRAHVKSENGCEDCRGKLAESDQLSRETDISMGGCLNCQRTKNAGIDCTFCHDQR